MPPCSAMYWPPSAPERDALRSVLSEELAPRAGEGARSTAGPAGRARLLDVALDGTRRCSFAPRRPAPALPRVGSRWSKERAVAPLAECAGQGVKANVRP